MSCKIEILRYYILKQASEEALKDENEKTRPQKRNNILELSPLDNILSRFSKQYTYKHLENENETKKHYISVYY